MGMLCLKFAKYGRDTLYISLSYEQISSVVSQFLGFIPGSELTIYPPTRPITRGSDSTSKLEGGDYPSSFRLFSGLENTLFEKIPLNNEFLNMECSSSDPFPHNRLNLLDSITGQ